MNMISVNGTSIKVKFLKACEDIMTFYANVIHAYLNKKNNELVKDMNF